MANVMEKVPSPVNSTISLDPKFNNITLSDGMTKLIDIVLAMNDCEIFSAFLQNLTDINATIPFDSSFWPGSTILHLAISVAVNGQLSKELYRRFSDQKELDSFLKTQVLTENEEMKYLKKIEICLEKGCSVNVMNANGMTPIHLAFKLLKEEIVDLLLNKCENDSSYSNELSFFHIASAIGDHNTVRRLLNAGVNVNSQTTISFTWLKSYSEDDCPIKTHIVPINSTALHIAATFHHKSVMKLLLNMGANIYAENALGLTAIHLSMIPYLGKLTSGEVIESTARLLLKRAPNLKDLLNNFGLSYLHIAAYTNDADTIKKLLQVGANVNSMFQVTVPELAHLDEYDDMTPLHLAIHMEAYGAVATLIKGGADIFQPTSQMCSALQQIMRYYIYYRNNNVVEVLQLIEKKLKQDQRIKVPIDSNDTTLLHVACYMYDFEWAKDLLVKGANVNACTLSNSEEDYIGFTPMHFLIYTINHKNYDNEQENYEFIKLLMDYGANLLIVDGEDQTPLLLAHNFIEEDRDGENVATLFPVADLCLKNQKSYKVNPANSKGFTHFHYACKRNHVDIVEKFLDYGIDMNLTTNLSYSKSTVKDFTALHVAVYYHSVEVACFLIEQGSDVNAENEMDQTPLHIAIETNLVNLHLFETFLSNGANLNAIDHWHWTPSDYLLESPTLTLEQLRFFRTHGASIRMANEKYGGSIGRAMLNAKACEIESVFEELILFCDVKNAMKNNYSPIEDIVSVSHEDIEDIANKLTVDFYLKAIQRFIDMGCDLDQQNEEGRTPLHEAHKYMNLEAVEALLLIGANINIIDKKNNPPIDPGFGFRTNTVADVFTSHIWKMRFIELEVNKLCDNGYAECWTYDPNLKGRCNDELASLSRENIGGSLNIASFLSERGAVRVYPMMPLFQRENVDRFFANPTNLLQQYPEFAGLLLMQYRKAVARKNMYEDAMSLLSFVLKSELPYLCLENILMYFNNDELKNFIEGQADHISTRKKK